MPLLRLLRLYESGLPYEKDARTISAHSNIALRLHGKSATDADAIAVCGTADVSDPHA